MNKLLILLNEFLEKIIRTFIPILLIGMFYDKSKVVLKLSPFILLVIIIASIYKSFEEVDFSKLKTFLYIRFIELIFLLFAIFLAYITSKRLLSLIIILSAILFDIFLRLFQEIKIFKKS